MCDTVVNIIEYVDNIVVNVNDCGDSVVLVIEENNLESTIIIEERGTRGFDNYELWKTIVGNENKTLQEYFDSFGSDALTKIVYNENLIGDINGVNATFQIQSPLKSNTEAIFVNEQLQKKINDYNIIGQTVTFMFSPNINETIVVNYIKS